MQQEHIRNEQNAVIGYTMTEGDTIHYFTYKHGQVGQYRTDLQQYTRWKTYPGHPMAPFKGMDYGMSDVLYWSEH